MSLEKRSVLVLGAGIFQVPLIKKAKARGFRTLVASIKGDYPGIEMADVFFEADTTNVKKILEIAKKNQVAAILTTGTDVSVPTLGAVAEKLNLAGPSAAAAAIVSSKTKFREFLTSNQLNTPAFLACGNAVSAWDFYNDSNKKLVIKPDDASGSRGVSILTPGKKRKEIETAFQNAVKYSRNGLVCLEEFLEGVEVGGDAFLFKGEFAFFTVTHKHMNGTLVKGHSLPGSLSGGDRERVKEEILKVVRKLGYINGPLNFDVIVSSEKAVVLEMGLRNGGNGIPDLIQKTYGIDLTDLYLDFALGLEIKPQVLKNNGSYSSLIFGSNTEGLLLKVSSLKEIQGRTPEVTDLILAKEPGKRVFKLLNNANLVGYLILKTGFEDYDRISANIEETLEVKVE